MADTADLLRDVLARLDVLDGEMTTLKQQNAALLAAARRVAPLSQPIAASASHMSPLERMSRRWVLRRGIQAAAATTAVGVLLQQDVPMAHAENFDTVYTRYVGVNAAADEGWALTAYAAAHAFETIYGKHTGGGGAIYGETTSADRPAIHGENLGSDAGVYGRNAGTGPAILGEALGVGGTGIKGTGRIGAWGESTTAGFDGVFGRNANGNGVRGDGLTGVRGTGRAGVHGSSSATGYEGVYGEFTGSSGYGVVGDGKGSNASGVLGRNPAGVGVRGEGTGGVHGLSSVEGNTGVTGQHTGANGFGVVGIGTGTGAGVFGTNAGSGTGVLGRNATGEGVRGEGKTGLRATSTSTSGYGALIEGGKAQLRIVPKSTTGKPTSGTHAKGELYLDSTGTIFICTVGGTPGTWRKVSTIAV